MAHAGRLEGAKAGRIKQFREPEVKYIPPNKKLPALRGGRKLKINEEI